MATLKLLAIVVICGCSNLQGLGGTVPPLVSFNTLVTGDLASVRPAGDTGTPDLHVALVWGQQWLIEPLCILPPESADAAAVIAAGCRDPFGFVPSTVDADISIEPNVPATIDLLTLPTADVLVGDLTARVGFASLVVYDNKDGNGILSLGRPNRPQQPDRPPDGDNTIDLVYGASMVTMTAADQRIAFRQGVFVPSAFYPRAGCGDPLPDFSVLAAGGFSAADAIAATIAGTLPLEDPASCAEQAPTAATLTFPLRPPAGVNELRCTERAADSTVRYREPPGDPPPYFSNRTIACVHYPSFGAPSDIIELAVTGTPEDSCVGLTHILKGCSEGPDCGTPDWDDAPPVWWPC